MRKAFTIVELMMVVGIIGILMGIATTAISSSIKQARVHKSTTSRRILEQGFATYYAQKGKWPGAIGERIANGSLGTRSNDEGVDGDSNTDRYVLTASEIDEMVRALINETKKNNPMMDISGLYVSRDQGNPGSKARGMDFMDAIRGTKQSKKKMKVAEMHFGYPDAGSGYFRHYKVVYSIPTDEMKVYEQ